ncbi:MAG TPA: protein kinase [Pirellulales bacterium]|nr:protein kinase [Pirellulales bacterium]
MQLEQLGPYRLARRLGRGGMGTVFEGLNVDTGQPAAIKVLNPHLAVEEGFRERFEIEIETLKKLKHPNIVRLYGFGEQDGVIFYAMELVHGTNLEDELQASRRFNWRETTSLGIKLARALQHAHDHGVIHRDLKPANLLLTPDGDVKLADFGIARLFGNTRLTSAGGLVGTAEYMAPEQADGRGVTPQCDLYSLGGVLFAMLAGRPPFWGGSLPEVLQLHRFAVPPPVARFAPDTPIQLGDIIARLLSKDPTARGTNARVIGKQLAALEHALSMPRESGLSAGSTAASTAGAALPVEGIPPVAKSAQPVRHEFELLPPGAETLPAEPPLDPFKTLRGHAPQPTADPAAPATSLSPARSQLSPTLAPPSSASAESAGERRVADAPAIGSLPLPYDVTAGPSSAGPNSAGPPPVIGPRNGAKTPPSLAVSPRTAEPSPSDVVSTGDNSNRMFSSAAASALGHEPRGLSHSTPSRGNRFITVEEDERRRAEADASAQSSGWIQIALLSLALASLVGLGLYMMRPPSADTLFARIETTVGTAGRPERLLDAENDIRKFLSRFPDDPHVPQIKSYAEEIELLHLERQFALSPRLAGAAGEPITHDYADAIREAANDPEQTVAKLQALIDFYGQLPHPSETTVRFIELAHRQLAHLDQQISKISPTYRRLIDANLARAQELRATAPEKARAIWSSIVELYGDKPWAADEVKKARDALAAASAPH